MRSFDPRYSGIEDVAQVIDFTRDGIYFTSAMPHYFLGMRLFVTFPYGDKISAHRTFLGSIVRIEDRGPSHRGIAVKFLW